LGFRPVKYAGLRNIKKSVTTNAMHDVTI
jgi:hypothetical protein